jgi:hypothetical protein
MHFSSTTSATLRLTRLFTQYDQEIEVCPNNAGLHDMHHEAIKQDIAVQAFLCTACKILQQKVQLRMLPVERCQHYRYLYGCI